ncbi:Crp/Fnr family transcriptional regulator [Texcoconibacillus texcoconensis]|uniref:CRP/FNR family transcriptional regulator n=1 Tax=Texcoconibacillus texcoconensis TaxID=1095777 RepID=A0A840QSN5_9BACI|nr:Crp/Fnr family transcriptional regulator [Texcoconibacillus texcoconensis]MBB5174360.1 CRP/FNR family transcriptional regulator [Texcoconibacillus texcoconensis]
MEHNQSLASFYDQLSTEAQKDLLSIGSKLIVQKGNLIIQEGDWPDHIYLLRSGKIRISKTTPNGKIFYLETKKHHELVGELSIFTELTNSFNAEVIEDATVFRFERLELEKLLSSHGEMAETYIRWLASQNHILLSKFRDLAFCGKQGALYSILIRLINEHGEQVEDGFIINRKVTNQELSNYIGATRESVNRILNGLTLDGIISIDRKFITIHDVEYFQDHLQCNYCQFDQCTI